MAEGARLESVYTVTPYRGFESLSLRQFPTDHSKTKSQLFNLVKIEALSLVLYSF